MSKPTPSELNSSLPQHRWSLRDFAAASTLFLASAAVVLWQNAHLAVLWDASYTLDTSLRIAQGQMPYRDFPLAHSPLTFLFQAAIIRLTGRVFFHHVLYAAIVNGLSTVLAWRIALRTLRGRLRAAWLLSLLLAAPLVMLGVYSILPFPSYDCDTAFSILLVILLLQQLPEDSVAASCSRIRFFLAGVTFPLPLFFKQNIGLPFLAAALVLILFLLIAKLTRRAAASHGCAELVSLLAGAVAMLLAAVLLLHATAGVRNYLHWTIQFAAERRLPGLQLMLSVYSEPLLLWWIPCIVAAFVLLRGGFAKAWWAHLTELTLFSTPILWMLASLFLSTDAGDRADILHALWPLTLILSAAYLLLRSRFAKTPWARPMALILLSAPFLWTLAGLFLATDAEDRAGSLLALWPLLLLLSAALTLWNLYRRPSLRAGLPILLLAAIHGTFLSQQLWGSTYAIWPLLMLLIAEMIVFLASIEKARAAQDAARTLFLSPALVAMISATLLICGGFYIVSEERLSYAELPTGPVVHSTLPALRGLAVPGPYLPAFEELLRFASEEIPVSDGLILIPGEDPFYFATGRVPQFPVLLFDKATDPYSPAQLVAEARLRNIRWLIVKREMQMKEDPTPQRAASLEALQQLFQPYRRLGSYDVYRRP